MALPIIYKMLLFSFAVVTDEKVDYQKQVRPVLQERCFACHGALKQEGGLRLDTVAAAIQGGESGAAIVPGDSDKSELLARISTSDLSARMPPESEALKAEEISAIRKWIEQGAVAPTDEVPESAPEDHWAFKSPVRPNVPVVANSSWVLNPVDAFVAATHEQKSLTPQPAADRRVWLRRVSLDLTGLAPSRSEQEAFLADQSPDAFEKVVDRLLDSPQYGERWGRHWMDIWRYSDWWGLGAEVRNSQKNIWHWRDWIIESLNEDKAYDQMLREMLAADELYPNDLQKLRASGFLARQYFKFNRTSWLDETIEHTSKAMLGLTVNCAKCHDHKYDPISHVDYYQMRAIFEPYQIRTDMIQDQLDFEKDGIPRAFDCNLDAATYLHLRGDDRNPDKERQIIPTVPAFLEFDEFVVEPVMLPAEAVQPGLRQHVIDAHVKSAEARIKDARTAVAAAKVKLLQSESHAKKLAEHPTSEEDDDTVQIVEENFQSEKPELWQQKSGVWSYRDGKLVQTNTGATRESFRLKNVPPTDFVARLKYVPTGGNMWKSVGIRFDVNTEDNVDDDDVVAYMSSYAGGPKLQVSYKNKGTQNYPAEGSKVQAINLNEPHEMTLLVRGTLINVIADGSPVLAYRLPIERRPGALELFTFDAVAEFTSFSLSSLPSSVMMTEASNQKSSDVILPVDQARLMVSIAEKSLRKFEAEPASIRARAAAERARMEAPELPATQELIFAAVRAERLVTIAKLDEELGNAELAVLQSPPEKKVDAESALAKATASLEESRKALDMPGDTFTSLTGALKTLENNLETEDSRRRPFPRTSTGRRSAFAGWVTDPRNPLPARVAVNHLWARHFGKGLVTTVFDFGRKGAAPSHPELLDWLAVEFVESGWSMKHIHRLIVLSNAYRLSSSTANAPDNNMAVDGDNRYYWRRNPVRMEAQLVRDNLLSMGGDLDLTIGGPSIPVKDDKSVRRSLYYVHSHNEHQTFLSMFDDANVLECYRRAESIVPQQALALENSPLAVAMAAKISRQIEASVSGITDEAFIHEAFLTVLNVAPTAPESAASLEAISELMAIASPGNNQTAQSQARTIFVLALLNHNDFVTVR